MKKSVFVIGSGISGLAIANRLCKKGFDVTVIEKQGVSGGIATSIPYKGCNMDIGPHILRLPKGGEIHDEIISLIGKDNLIEIPSVKTKKIRANKKFFRIVKPKSIFLYIKMKIVSKKHIAVKDSTTLDYYPKYGMSFMINSIVKEIERLGGRILFNTNIISISHHGNNKKIIYSKDSETIEKTPDFIVYSTPLPVTLMWFTEIPNTIKNELNKMQFLNSIMVFLIIDKSNLYNHWLTKVYGKDMILFRISNQSFLSDKIAPLGKTLLCIEIRTKENDRIEKLQESKLINQVKQNLQKIRILKNNKVDEYKVIKIKNLYPEHKDFNPNKIIEFITSFKNEYVMNTIMDGGFISSSNSTLDGDPKTTGIFTAMKNAETLTNRIIKDIENNGN